MRMRVEWAFVVAGAAILAMEIHADDYEFCQPLNLDNVSLDGGESTGFGVGLGGTPLGVVGFSVLFNYAEPTSDGSLASDLRVIITAPDGSVFSVGGFDHVAQSSATWSFQGAGSDGPGVYGDDPQDLFLNWKDDPQPNAVWVGTIINDRASDANPNQYNNLQVIFYTGPDYCAADVCPPGGDGIVGPADLAELLAGWGSCFACQADLVPPCGDGVVGPADLAAMLAAWGACP